MTCALAKASTLGAGDRPGIHANYMRTEESPGHGDGSVQAAIARTTSRGLALYFSRPVRLFRPAKGAYQIVILALFFTHVFKSTDGRL